MNDSDHETGGKVIDLMEALKASLARRTVTEVCHCEPGENGQNHQPTTNSAPDVEGAVG